MELGGNGGFQGYRRLPQLSSAAGMNAQPDISIRLPSQNQVNNSTAGGGTADGIECTVREQDRFMPIANVIRIMRKILPAHAKISDDAKETIQECVSEYISFITGEANDRCQREQRKTITAEDVLWAMSKLGFDDYIEPLTMYLRRYREYDDGELFSHSGEPLVKRAVDPTSRGIPTYAPPQPRPGYHFAHHPAFFGAVPPAVNGFLKDPSNGASASQAPVANGDQAFGQPKE